MSAFLDGVYSGGKQSGARRVSYPFASAQVPSVYPVIYDRDYHIYPTSGYTPLPAYRSTKTNISLYSEALDNATWTKTGSTITTDLAANPFDGTLNGDLILETAANSEHKIAQPITVAASQYTLSAFFYVLNRNWVLLRYIDSAAASFYAYFNISTGAVVTDSGNLASSAIAAVPSAYGNSGWYRAQITFTPAAGAGTAHINVSDTGARITYLGDIAYGVYCWGVQLELVTGGWHPTAPASAYISTTSVARSISSPFQELDEATEGNDPFAYLVTEEGLSESDGVGRFSRRHARVPADQVSYSTRFFNRPVMNDILSGSSYGVSFDEGITSHVWTSRISVSAVGSITAAKVTETVAARTRVVLPSNTTVTVQGPTAGTSTFYETDTPSTIATAFTSRGLTAVSVAVSDYEIIVHWTGDAKIEETGGDCLVSGGAGSVSIVAAQEQAAASDTSVVVEVTRVLTTGSAHSGSAGEWMAAWSNNKLIGFCKPTVASGSSVTIRADESPWNVEGLTLTHLAFAGQAAARYVNGPKVCTVKQTKKFYLPGVTSGITTGADVPNQDVYTDPISWLGRIIAVPTGYACIEVSDLTQWNGPILVQEIAEIQMADAIDTVAVGG